jgi:hypothetical protein
MKKTFYRGDKLLRTVRISAVQALIVSGISAQSFATGKIPMPNTGTSPTFSKEVSTAKTSADYQLKGKVIDATGSTIPGATVVLKGSSSVGTTTDADGLFTLSLPEGSSVLVVSSIGFLTQEVSIANKTQIDITLQSDVKALTEVVVTGYSSQSKRDITGSVSTVDAVELTKVNAPNVAQQLQGRVAGVTVTSNGSPGG